jgi:hypothetical protein
MHCLLGPFHPCFAFFEDLLTLIVTKSLNALVAFALLLLGAEQHQATRTALRQQGACRVRVESMNK